MNPNERTPPNLDHQKTNSPNQEIILSDRPNNTVIPQNLTPPTIPHKRNKKIIIILMVLAVIIGVVAYVILQFLLENDTPSSTSQIKSSLSDAGQKQADSPGVIDTSTWKTATNIRYQYKYKYPLSTDKYRWSSQSDAGNVEVSSGDNFAEFVYSPFLITIAPVGSEEDEGSVFRNNIEQKKLTENENAKLSDIKQVSKNGVAGTCWEFTAKQANVYIGKKTIDCHFVKNNVSYFVNIQDVRFKKGKEVLDATKDLNLVATGEAILNSFEFTD